MKEEFEDRGMMKYAPYQSLIEQAQYLAAMRQRKSRIPRPLISNDRAEEMNRILVQHHQGDSVKAEYWENGSLHWACGSIEKVDASNRFLIVGETRIPLLNLIDLEYV